MADRYRAAGWDVTGTSRKGGDGLVALDVTDAAAIRAFGASLDGKPVDLLVCNAGIYEDKGHQLDSGYPADMWARGFETNVTGVFLTLQALMGNIRAAKGKIAIISSQMASDNRAPGGSYVYRASKAAVLNLGRNLAVDLRGDGVAVGIYHPGWVITDMGGEGADITVDQSADGLVAEFERLDMDTTGCFRTYAGEDHAF